ncbi:MAG: hypothetical protein C7N36_20420, partial [Bacteroidetes bacterium]
MTYSFDPAAAGVGVHTLTYDFTDANGCSASASDQVEVFALPTVTFTAPVDLCIDAGVQAGLGSGTPTGGVYSGSGVTDGNNGMTYSFDPAAAGAGMHILTYAFTDGNGCSGSATDVVTVNTLPVVTMTTTGTGTCITAVLQTGRSGGTPTGGVYSGTGVTDDGNGMTYSFDPAVAGAGMTAVTYTFTDGNGCTNSDSDNEVVIASDPAAFTALADLCEGDGTQTGLGGGTPTGGVYSGPGVTDDGNGMTYSFNPSLAGAGTHILTYDLSGSSCSGSATDDVEVFGFPSVAFVGTGSGTCLNASIQLAQGSGTPPGGVYSGPGVTDDGNGMTYTFNPAAAGVGFATVMYTITDGNGCSNAANLNREVYALPNVTFTASGSGTCLNSGELTLQGGGLPGGGVYSGPGVTDDGNGMTYSFDPAIAGVSVHSLTYSFTDGNGCAGSANISFEVLDLPTVVFAAPAPGVCVEDAIVTGLGGGTPTGGIYSGVGVTDDSNGMTFTFDPAASAPGGGNVAVTYTFTAANGCSNSATDDIFVNPICCELIVTCPPASLGTIACDGTIPT